MGWFSGKPSADPQQVLRDLEELRGQLKSALGDDLVCLIAYGDIVRPGEYDPRWSQVNLMLVLTDVSTNSLDRIMIPIAAAGRKLRLTVMTLTEDDLVHSCDVFPIKFVDMQEHHRLVYGRDVLAGLKIADDHLRLRCEQELKNLMIRLRYLYLHHDHNTEELRTAMAESVSVLLRLLTIGLTLKTGISPEETDDILSAFCDEFGLDVSVLKTVFDMKHSVSIIPKAEVGSVFDEYMKAVHDAATAIDQIEVQV